MPVAKFDAKTTEWELAHLLDGDDEIKWWLRLYVGGEARVPTESGNYFPDFVAIDKDGHFWVIEGKANDNANDADVLRKKASAETWARQVRDSGEHGDWHYLFATETHIRNAGGSWTGLKTLTNPE